jgi:hypothetical protein
MIVAVGSNFFYTVTLPPQREQVSPENRPCPSHLPHCIFPEDESSVFVFTSRELIRHLLLVCCVYA